MRITYHPAKRDKTLLDRGVDFVDSEEIFSGKTLDHVDDRHDYGEERIVTVGRLRGRMMIVVWTLRDNARHIISMRKANEREQARFGKRLGEN
ncbi:MAG: BrnT family toxin [Magnetococcales bacterium]|nr:BrnT family toxin [Magnetococcales bacterium]